MAGSVINVVIALCIAHNW